MAETPVNVVPEEIQTEAQADGQKKLLSQQQLCGVIRALIAEKAKMQIPLQAVNRLARFCQQLRNENERLKVRAFNYEEGMIRAERRSAQLQKELYEAQKSGYSANKTASQIPFYLPSSVQQLVDSLAAQNVILAKGLQKATDNPKGAEWMEINLKLQKEIKALEDKVASKESFIESLLSKLENEASSDEEVSVLDQKKECMELKVKLRTYQNYIRHLREKNTAILQSIMDGFDKQNDKGPSESMDDGIADLYDERGACAASNSGSQNTSRESSQNASRSTSRRGSTKDTDTQHSASLQHVESQTDSDISCCSSHRGSIDSADIQSKMNLHDECTKQIDGLKEMIKKHTDTIEKQVAMENHLKNELHEMEANFKLMSADRSEQEKAEMNEIIQQLMEANNRKQKVEAELKEAEQIVSMMQEHVDNVNKGNLDIEMVKQELKTCKEQLSEMPMIQQVLKNYEEEIKSYGQERQELMQSQEKLKRENEQLQHELKKIQIKTSVQEASRLAAYEQQQQQQQQQQQRRERNRKMYEPPKEPWQATKDWFQGDPYRNQVVVADGSSSSRGNFAKDSGAGGQNVYAQSSERKRDFDRSRSTQDQYHPTKEYGTEGNRWGRSRSGSQIMSQEQLEQERDDRDYAENGTVKCETCGEKFPSALFKDHFRDCNA
eukprot:gene12025-13266_t